MRVLFDAHHIGSGQTGNETYARELLRALRRCDLEIVAAVARSAGDPALEQPVRTRAVPANGWLRLAALAIVGRSVGADVLHSIYYLPPLAGRPTVVSIHDVSYERYPEFFSSREVWKNRILVNKLSQQVRGQIQGMILDQLKERRSVWFG